MIILNVRTNDAGVFCLHFQYLIEHLIDGKQKEEIDWALVHILNNLFLKMEKISDIVDDVLPLELSEEEARTFYFTLTQKKYLEALEANPDAMEGSFYGSLLLIREKMTHQLEAKLKTAA
ncbi:MAG: hypothetical protein H6557_10545 [Lewinellaceae bacterium]|nr:hypothetical protein [Phaeodactylibacter sp.]MCB9037046.1 hypothetical protein [Lewinellaceae bacterium]